MFTRIEINVQTGERTEMPLTEDEISAMPPPENWRPQAIGDLNAYRAKLLSVLSAMLTVYQAKGESTNVDAVVAAMEAVTVLETAPGTVRDLYMSADATRAEFDLAVKARWIAIVAPAPAQVKADFGKYGGNTV